MEDPKEIALLLIEDDDVDAMVIQRAFGKLRIANEQYRARNGIEGLAMLRGEKGVEHITQPCIILLDLNMPKMNGLEFLAEIRKDENLHDHIIFVLTTSSADEDLAAAYRKNVAGYILKTGVANGLKDMMSMLSFYWKIVQIPNSK